MWLSNIYENAGVYPFLFLSYPTKQESVPYRQSYLFLHWPERVNVNRNETPSNTAKDEEATTESEKEDIVPQNTATGDETPHKTADEKPKLTVADDPFFLDNSSDKKPAGLDHLIKR